MAPVRENIDRFFDYDLDVESRTIYLGDGEDGEIDRRTAAKFVKSMHILHGESKTEPIRVICNTAGGDWHCGLAIYDAIACSPTFVTAEIYGHCMSTGAVLIQACDERLAHANAVFMLHDGSDSIADTTVRVFEAWGDESKRARQVMYRILSDATGKPLRYYERACAHDWILTAEQALTEGLIDRII